MSRQSNICKRFPCIGYHKFNSKLYVSIKKKQGGYPNGYDSFKLILNNIKAVSVTGSGKKLLLEIHDEQTVLLTGEGELEIAL
ncbi:hypothetical protein [Sporolactobacillus terrae]|uniref:hypothetical protein n=1 Tax=Sporolactobacillus terrae TaxID=269673 RepID=UPI0011184B24|nr:hypothetical protein [Sporolactobacillus terrae]